MKPIRIQRKRTKGWRMPYNYDMLALCHGLNAYPTVPLFVSPAVGILGENQLVVKKLNTLSIIKKEDSETMPIEGGKGNSTQISAPILQNKEKFTTREYIKENVTKSLVDLAENVLFVGLKILDAFKLTIKTEVGGKRENCTVGSILNIFTDLQMKNLISYTKYYALIVTQ